jgi:heterodisulfide reductase subunit A-like polyferredoxin
MKLPGDSYHLDKSEKRLTGAVLVQGGGIAGIQAALDLADSGFKVYLVERDAAIGGMMAHLDKTFPTGDCATCIVSPKLVECARNVNIEILTFSELVGLEGEPGNFTAKVKVSPSYVDEAKCNACGQCTDACPVNVPNQFDREMGTRKAIAKLYAQATPNKFGILKSGHAPCKVECPVNINVQGYVQLIKKKEYLKAVNLVRERNPLSAICGRVCTHPCESECTRNNIDSAVSIRLLKRFASDQEMIMIKSGELTLPEENTLPASSKKIAVVGAGPAGLTAAADLADRGYSVTVYEATTGAGGMLRWGIPAYRLPNDILDYEVELIRRKGIQFVYNTRVGIDISMDKLRQENEAVFLSVGIQSSRKLGVEGEDKTGIAYGLEFLRQAGDKDNRPKLNGKIVVIGGGNVAVDVARSALRLGADAVEIVSLEERYEMPALPEEVDAALEENIKINNGWGPKRILGNGKVNAIELKRCTRVFDENGRFSPTYNDNETTTLNADQIIVAIGQAIDQDSLSNMGVATDHNYYKVDTITLETSVKGIFAGGDNIPGTASVIGAVGAGKRAAESIDRYLRGEDMLSARFESTVKPVAPELLPETKGKEKKPRAEQAMLPVAQRAGNFAEVEEGLTEESALAEAERCLNCAMCSECQQCVVACEQHAVDHSMREKIIELNVGSVILTPGFEEFDATKKGEYGYGRYPNVITSVQFERMLSASGPFDGHVIRRSDGNPAKRVAWIQCVGSRDTRCGNEYCSSVCCMVSTKQSMVAADHLPGLEATIFYMDIRAHGKDFDQYYERAKKQGVHYIKGIPSRIIQVPGTKDLRATFYNDANQLQEKDFDLVILSVGMEPGLSAVDTAKRLGIELNEYGFCDTDRFTPLNTSRPGVFVGGAFQEPKDIPETVTQASAAASMAMELLSPARNTLITKVTYPDEHDVTDEQPRIGVFICHCGRNIASVVDVEKVVAAVAQEPNVALATHTLFTCSDTSLEDIRDAIRDNRLNRIVVASCTPRTHEPIFRDTLREAGLNQYLFEMANIRDQCSWVHSTIPEKATQKAVELVKMSVARVRRLVPLQGSYSDVVQNGLVIGGGVSGMTAALALAEQGFKTHLIERSDKLGGNFLNVHYTLEHEDVGGFITDLINRVQSNQEVGGSLTGLIKRVQSSHNIVLHMNSEVKNVAGFVGNFEVTFNQHNKETTVPCGAIIVATGANPAVTKDFQYGQSANIITQSELENALQSGTFSSSNRSIVMIQCAGSRNEERAYCSRICCSMAIKNALKLKMQNPDTSIIILYRDIRTYGFREKYYKQAREAGVIFMRYEKEAPPVISGNHDLVTLKSPDFPEPVEIETDAIVLSTGVDAPKDNRKLADMLKVPLNADGFYVEAHLKLRPVEFATEGIFLCGLAHSPKLTDENISQARATASRAATILSKTQLEVGGQVSSVDQEKCISCMTCVRACPYHAPFVNVNNNAEIAAAACMGCGICASECPAHAIQLRNFESEQFQGMLKALLSEPSEENKPVSVPK